MQGHLKKVFHDYLIFLAFTGKTNYYKQKLSLLEMNKTWSYFQQTQVTSFDRLSQKRSKIEHKYLECILKAHECF